MGQGREANGYDKEQIGGTRQIWISSYTTSQTSANWTSGKLIAQFLSLNAQREKIHCLMRRKKLCILILVILICLYLLYKSIAFEPSFQSSALIETRTLSSVLISKQKSKNYTAILSQNNLCSIGKVVFEKYCVISPYSQENIVASKASVSLSTQGTVEFLHHIIVLCQRWSGPISVAVYSPQEDYFDARRYVNTLRSCDFCIRHWVSWHFFFLNSAVPLHADTEISGDCATITQVRKLKKRRWQGTYPINVGRNIARSETSTPFVFPIDIELYPSPGILPKFERMLRAVGFSEGQNVWVLPVFEVNSKFKAPTTKSELRSMFMKKQAISFHQYRCDICHRIPNVTHWLNSDVSMKSEVNETFETLKVWATFKRNKMYQLQYWEPFFIGTRADPEFDIRLSWEGKQNKMQVAYEMCLMDYNFHVVENAFLVHAPGINVYNASKEKAKEKHILENNKWMSAIRKDLVKKYGPNDHC